MSIEIRYRLLNENECDRISEIDPSQYIERVWRIIDGIYQLKTINYLEESWPDGYETYRNSLEETIKTGGKAIGAFNSDDIMVGFVTINKEFFGNTAKYVLLDSMFVSRSYRGKGIGKELFKLCIMYAREMGADKIYICAGSAEDTIAFYKNNGCIEAEEINQAIYESDPRDIQLEFKLR